MGNQFITVTDTVKTLKNETLYHDNHYCYESGVHGFTLPECVQKGGDGTANSVGPDQTAPQGAV